MTLVKVMMTTALYSLVGILRYNWRKRINHCTATYPFASSAVTWSVVDAALMVVHEGVYCKERNMSFSPVLPYTLMDIILTSGGEYVWLEANPNGPFFARAVARVANGPGYGTIAVFVEGV